MTTFGKNLRNELLYQDVTVKELSRLTKIPYSTLICYMNTTNLPNVENGVKIARSLNVSLEFLVDGNSPNITEQELQKERNILMEITELVTKMYCLIPKKIK